MARGTYIVAMKNVTLATTPTAQTLVFINVGTTVSLEFLRFSCGQSGTLTSANLTAQIVTQVTAFPTLTSTAPVATSLIDQASKITGGTSGAAGTSGTNASAEGAGTKTVLYSETFNLLNGWLYVPVPEERIVLSASGSSGLGLYLATAPATGTLWSAEVVFREV